MTGCTLIKSNAKVDENTAGRLTLPLQRKRFTKAICAV